MPLIQSCCRKDKAQGSETEVSHGSGKVPVFPRVGHTGAMKGHITSSTGWLGTCSSRLPCMAEPWGGCLSPAYHGGVARKSQQKSQDPREILQGVQGVMMKLQLSQSGKLMHRWALHRQASEFWNNAQLDRRAKMCKTLKGKQNHNNPNNLHFDSEFGEPFNLNLFHTCFPSWAWETHWQGQTRSLVT